MSGFHTVQQGEYLSKIAADYGFRDYQAIWNHAENAELKSQRQTPNVLFPGDRIFIPDRESKTEDRPTDKLHQFRALGEKLQLKIKIKDLNGLPVKDTPCGLAVENLTYSLTTDGDGIIQQEIPRTAQTGRLTVKAPDVPIDTVLTLSIGGLDPLEEESGQRQRLNNLGYNAGESDSQDPQQFRSAVEEFQCDFKVTPITGICDATTQAKLKEAHGC